jgi:hypothetical protein
MITESITALIKFLDASPTDAEAWTELSDLYMSQGLYQQGIFALEEVLLITPNAWNVSTLRYVSSQIFLIGDRYMHDWQSYCTWELQWAILTQKKPLQNLYDASAGVSSYVTIIFAAIMD